MTVTETPPQAPAATASTVQPTTRPTGLAAVVGTADHKVVGRLFIATSLAFLLVSGIAGQLVSTERADLDVVADDTVFQLFTLHTISGPFLFLVPMLLGLAMVVVPLQVGASTVAFPRAAAASYWAYLVSGALLVASYVMNGGPTGGSDAGVDLWAASFAAVVVALLLASICIVTTVAALRAKGMGLSMVPMFSWSMLVAGTVWILSLSVLVATLVLIYVDHQYGQVSFGANAEMYSRIVWALRQPQVYAYAVPALGIITDALVTVTGRRLVSRPAAMGAIGLAGALGFGAFLQRSINPDAVEQPLFVIMSVLAVLPLLGLFGLWADLARRGRARPASPMVFAVAAALMLLVATLVGAIVAVPLFDMTGSVAEFGQAHYALLGASIAALGGLWLWASKIFGRPLPEALGLGAALLVLLGTIALSLPDVISGAFGDSRDAVEGVDALNKVSALGGLLTLAGVLVAVAGLLGAARRRSSTRDGVDGPGADRVADDPWGTGATLEWTTASPPIYENFATPPAVTSATPLLDERDGATGTPQEVVA